MRNVSIGIPFKPLSIMNSVSQRNHAGFLNKIQTDTVTFTAKKVTRLKDNAEEGIDYPKVDPVKLEEIYAGLTEAEKKAFDNLALYDPLPNASLSIECLQRKFDGLRLQEMPDSKLLDS